jgi:hypothetical protein
MVPLPVTIIDREPVSCVDMVGDDVTTTPAPFTAFERVYAQTAGSTDASLRAIAKQEFISVFNEQRRRLLVANGEFLAPLRFGNDAWPLISMLNLCSPLVRSMVRYLYRSF